VDQPALVDLAQRRRDADRQRQELLRLQERAEDPGEWRAARPDPRVTAGGSRGRAPARVGAAPRRDRTRP
jgi:hypothetical protein